MKQGCKTEQKGRNWAYLIFLCTVGFFVVSRKTSLSLFAMAYPFLGTIAWPGCVFLLGWSSRRWRKDWRQTVCAGLGMIALGYLEKVLVYWAQVLLGMAPVFYPFSTSGVAWVFLVAGTYLVIAGLCHDKHWSCRKLLLVTLAVGLVGGLVRPFDAFLCLGQLCAYAPFFALGRCLSEERLQAWGADRRLKLPALLLLLAAAAGCVLLRRQLTVLWPMVDGDSWYGACGGLAQLLPLGMLVRLGWYALGAGLLLALYCLTPSVRIPLLTEQGGRFTAGYFWFMPLAYLTSAPLRAELSLTNLALSGGLTVLLLLAAPSRWGDRFVRQVICWPGLALAGRAEPERLEGTSFYRRHKWAIDMTALFTLAFVAVMVAYTYPFFSNGKSLIWVTDGMGQQYPMLFYFKDYLLGGLRSLLETGKLSFPQWDFTLGFGMSPMDAVRREPFMLLALLGNEETMETVANVMVILRHYVCGLAFLWLCAALGKRDKLPVLMGTLVYVFSGYAILISVRQPYFATVLMTYLPLMLIGAERYIQERKYGLFVFAVFLQVVGDYYFAYINGLILAVYLLIRLGCRYGKDIRRIVGTILRLIGFYAWGALMSMATLLPGLLSLFSSARSQGDQNFDLFYTNGHYRKLFTGLNLEFGGSGFWTFVSLAAIGWLACILLFLRRRKELLPLKIGFVSVSVFICFPVFGLIANGFAYVCNRWAFAIPLVVGLILVEMAPDFLVLSKRDKGILLAAVLLYSAIAVTRPEMIGQVKTIGLLILCMTALVLLLQEQFLRSRQLRMGVMAVITVLTVMLNLAASFLPDLGGYVNECQASGEAYESMSGSVGQALSYMEEDGFYRVGQASAEDIGNQSMGLSYYGANTYYSVNPQGISEYCTDICLSAQYQVFRIYGLDERAAPNALAAVRYYVKEKGGRVPYGFVEKEKLENGAVLYENQNALPLGYTYTDYISRADYDGLTPLEKQQVMLEGAVLEEDTGLLSQITPTFREERIECQLSKAKNIQFYEGEDRRYTESGYEFLVGEDASLEFTFQGKPGCETYLVMKGLRHADDTTADECRVICEADGYKERTALRGRNQSYYFEKDATIFHLGYSDEALTSCKVTFSSQLIAAYDEVYVVCVPMDSLGDQVSRLGEVALENVSEQGDVITGTLELEESRLLALSIPYVPGWTAYVNGQEAELLRVNVMYCGLLLEPGSYEIELRYEHPGQKTGAIISAAAIAAVLPVWGISALRRKRQKQ